MWTEEKKLKAQEVIRMFKETLKEGERHASPAYWARLKRMELKLRQACEDVGIDFDEIKEIVENETSD